METKKIDNDLHSAAISAAVKASGTKIIDGAAHAAAIRKQLKAKGFGKKCPHLAVVLLGSDPASLVYIRNKQKACEEIGIGFTLHKLEEGIEQDALLAFIEELNNDTKITGILVQYPLPAHINKRVVAAAVAPQKDVDGLGMGSRFTPCTPGAVLTLLQREKIKLVGKHVVIIGRSEVVGKPLALMMLDQNATVTICHSYTYNLPEVCRQADILVCAVGVSNFVTSAFVKPGAVVIDIGINRLAGGGINGDVNFINILGLASYITPVPGGVGPMTVATLMQNCIKAVEDGNA